MIYLSTIILLFFAFVMAAVRVAGQSDKRMKNIFEDEESKRN